MQFNLSEVAFVVNWSIEAEILNVAYIKNAFFT